MRIVMRGVVVPLWLDIYPVPPTDHKYHPRPRRHVSLRPKHKHIATYFRNVSASAAAAAAAAAAGGGEEAMEEGGALSSGGSLSDGSSSDVTDSGGWKGGRDGWRDGRMDGWKNSADRHTLTTLLRQTKQPPPRPSRWGSWPSRC